MKLLHLLQVYGFSKYSVRERGNCLEPTPVQVFLFVFCFLFFGGEGDLCNYYCVFYFIPRSISCLCLLMLEVDCRVTVTSHNIHDKPTEQAGMLGNQVKYLQVKSTHKKNIVTSSVKIWIYFPNIFDSYDNNANIKISITLPGRLFNKSNIHACT